MKQHEQTYSSNKLQLSKQGDKKVKGFSITSNPTKITDFDFDDLSGAISRDWGLQGLTH